MELLDYLKWRNDISLSISPFNDIDKGDKDWIL